MSEVSALPDTQECQLGQGIVVNSIFLLLRCEPCLLSGLCCRCSDTHCRKVRGAAGNVCGGAWGGFACDPWQQEDNC